MGTHCVFVFVLGTRLPGNKYLNVQLTCTLPIIPYHTIPYHTYRYTAFDRYPFTQTQQSGLRDRAYPFSQAAKAFKSGARDATGSKVVGSRVIFPKPTRDFCCHLGNHHNHPLSRLAEGKRGCRRADLALDWGWSRSLRINRNRARPVPGKNRPDWSERATYRRPGREQGDSEGTPAKLTFAGATT